MDITVSQITPRREEGRIAEMMVHFTTSDDYGGIRNIPIKCTDDLVDFKSIEDAIKRNIDAK